MTEPALLSKPIETGLREVTARAMGWQSLSTVVVQLLQAAMTLTVAAHVAPQEFALWGVAAIVVNAQHLIGSLGLAPALVYFRARGWFRDGIDGAFLVTVVLGMLGAGCLAAAAPGFASFFREGFLESDVITAVRAMSVVFLFLTIASVPQALIEKTLDFRRRALPEMTAAASYALLAIVLMLGGFGVWSLIIAKMVQSALLAGLCWFAAPVRPRALPRFRLEVVRSLFRYGRFLTAAAVVGFAVGNLDTVAVGRLIGATALGAYALAFTVGNLVPTFLSLTLGKVFFPLYAAIRDDRDGLCRAFTAAVHYLGVVMLPTTLGLVTFAPEAFINIFGDRWRPAAALLGILALYGLARAICSATTIMLAAIGRPDLMLWASGFSLAVPIALLWPLAGLGVSGIAWAFTAGQIAAAIFALSGTRSFWTADALRAVCYPFLATGAALLAALWTRGLVPENLSGTLPMLAYGFCYVGILVPVDPEVRGILASLLSCKSPSRMADSLEVR